MRILIAHKFYYLKGGADIHALIQQELLRSRGHKVAFFAMQHPDNKPTGDSLYFPSEIDYTKKNYRNFKEKIIRPLSSAEVKRKFLALLNDFKPDILHCHNIHSQLSPLIVEEAWKKNIPVVWTLHDFKLLCPRYDCRRDNEPCELCFTDKRNVLRYRCLKNSFSASLLAYLEALKWNREKMSRTTSVFISPSEFIRQKFMAGGFPGDKIITINNFIPSEEFNAVTQKKEGYICYVGRLSKEKGVETLLKASSELPHYPLKIIGTGPLHDYFIEKYNHPHIEFCGHRKISEVQEILSKAIFSVMPSECYENNPLAVIESLCLGTPVLGANIGGIPELIAEDKTGYLFDSGNAVDLKDKIDLFYKKGTGSMDISGMAEQARERYSAETFMGKLLKVYEDLLNKENEE